MASLRLTSFITGRSRHNPFEGPTTPSQRKTQKQRFLLLSSLLPLTSCPSLRLGWRRGCWTHLKVPPGVFARTESRHDGLELANRHLRQVVVVDNRTASRLLATDDVTAGGLRVRLSVEAEIEVDWRRR